MPGEGGAALFVHGLGGGPYETQWLAEDLHARTGLAVRSMMLPGHEAPARRMPASRHEDWVAAVARERDALRASLPEGAPVHLVGFSTGCIIALRVEELHGSTGRVVLLAPFIDIYRPPLLPVRPEVLLEMVTAIDQVPRRGPRLRDRALRREVDACLPFPTMSLAAARSAKVLGELVMRDLAHVRAPVLLLQGMRDRVVDPSGAVRIEARLSGERRLVMLETSDHLVALDEERRRVFDETARFLAPR